MANEQKTYVGIGREKKFQDGNSIINLSLSLNHLETLRDNCNADGWVVVAIARRREVSDKGQTHYGYINTYQAKRKDGPAPEQPAARPPETQAAEAASLPAYDEDKLPF
jgi:hypothetical protein